MQKLFLIISSEFNYTFHSFTDFVVYEVAVVRLQFNIQSAAFMQQTQQRCIVYIQPKDIFHVDTIFLLNRNVLFSVCSCSIPLSLR